MGEKLLIVGRSGAGKSTLLNLLSGILRASSGEVSLLGCSYANLSARQLDALRANQVGFIFQSLNLIPYLNGFQNAYIGVQFSKRRRRRLHNPEQEIYRLASALGFEHSELNQPANELSLGQQQRIASLRALLGEPSLILADEPTSSLDAESTEKFLNELTKSLNGATQSLVMVSHDHSLRSYFDHIIDLDDSHDI